MIKRIGPTTASAAAIQARSQISEGMYPVRGSAYQVSSSGYGMCYSDRADDKYDFSEVDCIKVGSTSGLSIFESYIDRGFIVFDSVQLGGDSLIFLCREKEPKTEKKSGWALVKYEEVEAPE